MRSIILSVLLLLSYIFGFTQTRLLDSLKGELKVAKADTTKLRIYLLLGDVCEKRDKLEYTEPALNLVDKLLLKEQNKHERQKLIEQEQALLYPFGFYYRYSNTAEWDKAMANLQSRLQAIERTGDQKRAATFLYEMARISLDEKKDSSLFRTYMLRSISVAKENKDTALIVNGYLFMGSFYSSAGNYTEGLEVIQSSISFCKKLNYNKGLIQSYRLLATLYGIFSEYDLALENLQTALDISSKTKDTLEICHTLRHLGSYYAKQKNIKKALEYWEQLQKISIIYTNSPYSTGDILTQIGNGYSDNNDFKNAQLFFEKSLHSIEEDRNDVYNSWRLPIILMLLGNVHQNQNNFKKALDYHTRSINLIDSIGDPNQIRSYILYLLAKDYYGLKNYIKAKELNDNAIVDFKRDWFDVEGRIEIEFLAMKIDSARGDGFGALSHYKEYINLKDKMKGDEIKREAQKDKFKAEQEKQNLEQEKKDAIAKRTRNLQYIVIGAFFLLGIFLTYGYFQKNKDKKQIEKAYTELKSTQAQLIQSEKMASLGELTAGIAHEIQNPLNFVNNFSELNKELLVEMNEEIQKGNLGEVKVIAKDIYENEEKINHHGNRAADIVKSMLQHSRSSSGAKMLTDINALADEYLRLAYHGLRAKDKSFNATMDTKFDPTLPEIAVVSQDIGRVLLNLITNAFYAVNERSKKGEEGYIPTVSITTKLISKSQVPKANSQLLIAIKDNGSGIPEHIKEKIFQPFFTTKPTGQGTGLGLSLAYDIVKAHGGELNVETKEGEGSIFIISIPYL